MPSMRERHEDLPHIIKEIAEELTKKKQSPPAWLSDMIAKQNWDENFDQLQSLLKNGLAKEPDLGRWTPESLPPGFDPTRPTSFTRASDFLPKGKVGPNVLKMALIKAGGDRSLAAKLVGLSKPEFLRELLVSGQR